MAITFHTELNRITESAPYVSIRAEVLKDIYHCGTLDFVASHIAELPYYDLRDGQPSNAIGAQIWALKQFAEEHAETVPQGIIDHAVDLLRSATLQINCMSGKSFRDGRERLGLTQTQVGAAFGVTLRQVQNWEKVGPSGTAARYMQALLSGWRPDDWPK